MCVVFVSEAEAEFILIELCGVGHCRCESHINLVQRMCFFIARTIETSPSMHPDSMNVRVLPTRYRTSDLKAV